MSRRLPSSARTGRGRTSSATRACSREPASPSIRRRTCSTSARSKLALLPRAAEALRLRLRAVLVSAAQAPDGFSPPGMPSDAPTYRPAAPSDALCRSVLATQVFLDTYATQGIRPAIAREIRQCLSEQAFAEILEQPRGAILLAEIAGHRVG